MDCTHIYLIAISNRAVSFALFGPDGTKVYEGSCAPNISEHVQPIRNRKLDERVHEQVVRQITRECTELDISMRTPIFAV